MNKEEKVFSNTVINWYPGHMAKTKREIKELLPNIDLVYELVDARIPYSSKINDINDLLKNKKRILIMTKKDVCDLNETNKWVNYYESIGYKVALADLNNNNDYKKIINITNEISNSINKSRVSKGLKEKRLQVLVIGIPNVGKSTLINKLAGKKVATVGNKPGVTTKLVWLNTKYNISILDTPGILWPKFDTKEIALNLASMSAIKIEVIDKHELCLHILDKLNKYYKNILKSQYNIDNININDQDSIVSSYDIIANKYGYKVSKGETDYTRVADKVINDIKNNIVKNITFDRR